MSTRSKQREAVCLMLNLPEGVHDEIFLNLPAKSILVSRCVCKVFYNLLSKPNFIKNHVNRSILSNNSNPKLLFSEPSDIETPMIHSIPMDNPSISSSNAVLINYPFESTRLYLLDFLGSCRGLICLRMFSIDRYNFLEEFISETKFCILNPLTREFKEFKMPENCYGNLTCGFGYDSKNDDYKLVMLSNYKKGACCRIYVCTVKSDSWISSSIQSTINFSFRNGRGYRGVFFNGRLHWLASIDTHGTSSEVIFSFDISNEIVVTMPLPENIMPPTDHSGEVYKNVGVWGDCIGVACIWNSDRIDVWVMQEYGVQESWVRKYTTTQMTFPLPLQEIPIWKPLWCFKDGEILVDTGKQIVLYEPKTERVTSVVVRDVDNYNSRQIYVESIVSLGSGTYLEKPVTDGVGKNSE